MNPRIDPRVDAYIAKAKPFAQPILKQLRATVHAASPKIVETIKWGSPSFEYKGMLCGYAAFKKHCPRGSGGTGSTSDNCYYAHGTHGNNRNGRIKQPQKTGGTATTFALVAAVPPFVAVAVVVPAVTVPFPCVPCA